MQSAMQLAITGGIMLLVVIGWNGVPAGKWARIDSNNSDMMLISMATPMP
jgi:hypothetical protein